MNKNITKQNKGDFTLNCKWAGTTNKTTKNKSEFMWLTPYPDI